MAPAGFGIYRNVNEHFSLMKDMTGKDDQFRGPAIRALCSITDVCTSLYFYYSFFAK